QFGMLLGTSVLISSGLILILRRLLRTSVYDMELVREKVTRIACRAELRLVIYAPAQTRRQEVRAQLERVAAAYRRYNLAAANGLIPHAANPGPDRIRAPAPWRAHRQLGVLTTLELAGVWHLPHAAADVALLERTSARRWLPLPAAVAEGCHIGGAR